MTGTPQVQFPRTARLLKHADFQRVYESGRRHFSGNITVFFLRRIQECAAGPRVGFTVSRALGGAVQRNRMRRRLREAVRGAWQGFDVPADVVINPKKSVLTVDFQVLTEEVAKALATVRQKLKEPVKDKSR